MTGGAEGQSGLMGVVMGLINNQPGGLAQILPGVVDKLTPNGEVPSGDLMEQGLAMLKGKLFS